jgi:hypothetical protein
LENKLIYSWKLNSLNLEEEIVSIDTSLKYFQNYNLILKNGYPLNYLGNLGSAVQINSFFNREDLATGFIFSEPYSIYFHSPQNQKYFNTKQQFSVISYANAGPKNESEQTLGVLHTQNITKDLNVGIDYDMISSDGRYLNQQVKQNNLSIFSSYKKKRYSFYGALAFNRLKAQENGGIDSLDYLGSDEYRNRRNIPVKEEDASIHVYSTNLKLINEYKFGRVSEEINVTERKAKNVRGSSSDILSDEDVMTDAFDRTLSKDTSLDVNNVVRQDSIIYDTTYIKVVKLSGYSLTHEFIYDRHARKYFDNTIEVDSFYNEVNVFLDSNKTYDKVYQTRIANKVSFNFSQLNHNIRLSLYNEQMDYSYIKPEIVSYTDKDTVLGAKMNLTKGSTSLNAVFDGGFGKLNYLLFGEYYFEGYKNENSEVSFNTNYLVKSNNEIGLRANYVNRNPDFYYEKFYSNHFQWENHHFRMEEKWDLELYYRNQKRSIDLKLIYGQVSNYFFFDESATISQNRGQINVLSGEILKEINLGPFHSKTKFLYQRTSDSFIRLPEYSLYQTLYLEKLFKFESTGGKLLMQIGIDYRYSSSYYADAYMPISGVFYTQNEIMQKDYHRMDAFINFNINRASLFLRYDYLNSAISKNYYFTAPFYPSPQPVFKFGVSWIFYD